MGSTVIKGGTVVTADLTYGADVRIEGGRIAEIGPNLSGDTVLDATGCYVMPGGIDPHTHLEMPFMGTYSADDFDSGTRAALAGGTVAARGGYPGWQYTRESQFRDTLLAAYKDLTGKDGVVEATHGGLECGLLMEKIPGLDAVSMGPELHDVHSVRERLSVPSTERTYELVCELLRRSC